MQQGSGWHLGDVKRSADNQTADALKVEIPASAATNTIILSPGNRRDIVAEQGQGADLYHDWVCVSTRVYEEGYNCGYLVRRSVDFQNQLYLREAEISTDRGDSGAPVWTDVRTAVGQVVAGNGSTTLYSHIYDITSALRVDGVLKQ